jgi:xanthine dehydrogenase accessory factor
MSLREVHAPLAEWTRERRRAALATLIRVRRSAPRPPGARFAVSEGGDLAGSVSSGCVEGDLHEHLQRILDGAPPAVVQYGISDEMAAEVGLSCGGEIEVLLAPHDPDDPAWHAAGAAVASGEPAVLITGVSEPIRSRCLLVRREGEREGTLGSSDLDGVAVDAVRALFDHGGATLLELDGALLGTDSTDASEQSASLECFAEAFLPPPRLAIVGATPIAEELCRLASGLGYRVSIVDPREAFMRAARFPDADKVIAKWPDEGLEDVRLDRYLSVVVLTHDEKLDVPALAAALQAGSLYVGLLGGRRTQRLRREALAELGLDPGDVNRIRGPVGLDIGADTPAEIALSILAEMIAVRHGV